MLLLTVIIVSLSLIFLAVKWYRECTGNNFPLFSKVKIDYSIEAKKNYRPNMSGEFAIYKRKSVFHKWIQVQAYADIEWAKSDAMRMVKEIDLPKYY